MYNDLQDALGYRTDQNAPFNPTYSIAALPVSSLPIDPAAPVPADAKLVPGGVQPNMKTPTLISWSLRVQRELSPNTSLTVGYVGSHGYHEIIGFDANEPIPDDLSCGAVPRGLSHGKSSALRRRRCGFPAGSPLAGAPVPAGSYYIPCGHAEGQRRSLANTWTWFSLGRQHLQRIANRREPPVQPRIFGSRRLHLVEGAG